MPPGFAGGAGNVPGGGPVTSDTGPACRS